ncbi:hypothetical protein [Nocardioides sp. TF02-7]|uniref:hypothetical protein n=1 Tax=Nocardioides sp. TF02-7 TaxID=2917724 RepID=UPI001F063603|nr:hypothetical protein [Nocardioides sp. TF02-7]UMG94557.1 hypothetical protein MF408_11735 [Nocardioides sp. TF02-7]
MTAQRWHRTVEGRAHRVEAEGSARHRVRWYVDDELVAERAALEDKIRLRAADRDDLGGVLVRFSGLGAPRRATLFAPGDTLEVQLGTGAGGTDLDPEPGSAAERHEQRMLAHPTRYTLLSTATAVAAVAVPILLAALLARLAFSIDLPDLPWPDLPRIPWPDLPAVPWPDLPSVPWPDWSVPGWVREVLSYLKYVWPVVLAFVVARGEIRRRRREAERREAAASEE